MEMNEMIGKKTLPICIAIQVETVKNAIATGSDAISLGAQFIEYRIDYSEDVENWDQNMFNELVKSTNCTVILTMRSPKEGGKLPIEEPERFDIIRKCIKAKPAYVDVEASLEKIDIDILFSLSKENEVNLIYSYHDFQETPSNEKISTLIEEFELKCPGLDAISSGISTQNILKLIFTAKRREDNKLALSICENFQQKNRRIVCFCMGELGIFSRVFSILHGGFFSFASITKSTAPGQVSYQEFINIIQRGEGNF
jgi:3-dehydroquinate dehydratase I